MQPTNQPERKKAFWNFLLFFGLTVIVIVTTLLFSFKVPFKENDQMRNQMEVVEKEKAFVKSFEIKVNETVNLLDSVNLVANAFKIDNRIDGNIDYLTEINNKENSSMRALFNVVIENLRNLQVAKEEIRMHNKNTSDAIRKDEQVAALQARLDDCNNKLIQMAALRSK